MRLLAPSNFECQELVQACTGHWKTEMFEAPLQAQRMMRWWSSEWGNVWVLVTQHSQSGQILRVQEFGKQIASHRKLNSSDGKLDVVVCQHTFTRQYLRFQLWRTFWFTLNMINKYKETTTMCHHSSRFIWLCGCLRRHRPPFSMAGTSVTEQSLKTGSKQVNEHLFAVLYLCCCFMLFQFIHGSHLIAWYHTASMHVDSEQSLHPLSVHGQHTVCEIR